MIINTIRTAVALAALAVSIIILPLMVTLFWALHYDGRRSWLGLFKAYWGYTVADVWVRVWRRS